MDAKGEFRTSDFYLHYVFLRKGDTTFKLYKSTKRAIFHPPRLPPRELLLLVLFCFTKILWAFNKQNLVFFNNSSPGPFKFLYTLLLSLLFFPFTEYIAHSVSVQILLPHITVTSCPTVGRTTAYLMSPPQRWTTTFFPGLFFLMHLYGGKKKVPHPLVSVYQETGGSLSLSAPTALIRRGYPISRVPELRPLALAGQASLKLSGASRSLLESRPSAGPQSGQFKSSQ